MNRFIKCVALTFAVAPALTGCGPETEMDSPDMQGGDAPTASVSEAMTNVDPCAMGTTANATGTISTDGASDNYLRAGAWIDSICPASGKDRTTTIVDFWVHGVYNAYSYRFLVQPSFWDATNQAECMNLKMATRVQRRNTATGAWEDVKYLEQAGQWVINLYEPNFGHCNTPYFYYERQNYKDYYNTETNMYRVRTWALQSDGTTHANVLVTGINLGNYY